VDAGQELQQSLHEFAAGVMHGQPSLTVEQLAEQSDVPLELTRRLRRAMGLPDVPPGEVAFYQSDLDALRHASALLRERRLDVTEVLHLTRTLGLATAQIADVVAEFWIDRSTASGLSTGSDEIPPGSDRPPDGSEWWDASRVPDVEWVVLYLLRRHLLNAVTRRTEAAFGSDAANPLAVGFADLVGFTSLSEHLSDRETAELVERFEVTATDAVVGGGGRVVKMIGDEVMFSAEVSDVGEIALSLAESFDPPVLPSVRVGVASGRVVSQSGDLYGPAVNLAARATMTARPGTVLVSPSLADALRGDERYELVSLRPQRLKGIGSVALWLLRRRHAASRPARQAG
jgi:adenylate cyclase